MILLTPSGVSKTVKAADYKRRTGRSCSIFSHLFHSASSWYWYNINRLLAHRFLSTSLYASPRPHQSFRCNVEARFKLITTGATNEITIPPAESQHVYQRPVAPPVSFRNSDRKNHSGSIHSMISVKHQRKQFAYPSQSREWRQLSIPVHPAPPAQILNVPPVSVLLASRWTSGTR